MKEILLQATADRLGESQRILVVSHVRPDGDAIGSLLGLGLTLQAFGKQVVMALADGVPASYQFLAGAEQVVKRPVGAFDTIIAVDCSDLKRIGDLLDGHTPHLNIDHHITNENYAMINLVDDSYVATAEILTHILPKIGLNLSKPAAAALLTGIVTDTLGFRTSNVNPRALRTAAELLEFGIDLPQIFERTLFQRNYEAIEYWAAGLERLQKEGEMVWTSLTRQDRSLTGYPGRDDADLINILSSISGINIAIIFVEQNHETIKVSWRARPGFDVSKIALEFGGGGHPAAAGADIPGNLSVVEERVLAATRSLLKQSVQLSG
jgi:phosphoesterase RecJ-like protein